MRRSITATLGALMLMTAAPALASPREVRVPARAADALSHVAAPLADCTLFSGAPDDVSRCGAPSTDSVGVDGNGAYYRTLIAFPAGAGIPSGSTVLSATLNLNVLGVFGSTTTWLFQLSRPFAFGGASWNSAAPGQPWSSAGGDGAQPLQAAQQVGAAGTASFSITKLVQSWVDGASPELILLPASAKGNAFSMSSAASGQGPSLVIAYQPPAPPPVQTTPQPTPIPSGSGAHALKVKLVFAWTWRGDAVALHRVLLGRGPAGLTLSVRCRGRGCPRPAARAAIGRAAVRRLLHRLAGTRFQAGDVVTVTLTAAGYRPERAVLRIRRGRIPLVRSLPS